eukprot:UN00627
MFRAWTYNEYLSLAEIELGILTSVGYEYFHMKRAIKEAYKAARDSIEGDKEGLDEVFVAFNEFRTLLVCLRRYFELHAPFDAIDTTQDHSISLEEFKKSILLLKEWGVEIDNAKESYKEIDESQGGKVLFDEFASWALKKGLDFDTKFTDGDESDDETRAQFKLP